MECRKCLGKKYVAYLVKSLDGKHPVYQFAVAECCNRSLLPYLLFFVACAVAFVVFDVDVVDDEGRRMGAILDCESAYCSRGEDDTTDLYHHLGTQNDEEARMTWTEEDPHSMRNGMGSLMKYFWVVYSCLHTVDMDHTLR